MLFMVPLSPSGAKPMAQALRLAFQYLSMDFTGTYVCRNAKR